GCRDLRDELECAPAARWRCRVHPARLRPDLRRTGSKPPLLIRARLDHLLTDHEQLRFGVPVWRLDATPIDARADPVPVAVARVPRQIRAPRRLESVEQGEQRSSLDIVDRDSDVRLGAEA